jgi:hypothetical protein
MPDTAPRYPGLVPLVLAVVVALALAVPFFLLLVPLSLFQRYRMGTARRPARGWVAALNVGALVVSVAIFLTGATVTSFWFPKALPYSLAGLLAGAVLGVVGLLLSRWEKTPDTLHYTPNRWLVLFVTLIVTGRLLYGLWRSVESVHAGSGTSVITAFGPAGSLAAGAVVIGYYLAFWAGVWRRFRRHRAG